MFNVTQHHLILMGWSIPERNKIVKNKKLVDLKHFQWNTQATCSSEFSCLARKARYHNYLWAGGWNPRVSRCMHDFFISFLRHGVYYTRQRDFSTDVCGWNDCFLFVAFIAIVLSKREFDFLCKIFLNIAWESHLEFSKSIVTSSPISTNGAQCLTALKSSNSRIHFMVWLRDLLALCPAIKHS